MHELPVLRVHHHRAPHLAVFGDQVDDRPVRELRHDQAHQPAQRLLDVEGGGQLGGRLGQQGQPLQLRQGAVEPVRLGAGRVVLLREVEDHQGRLRPAVQLERGEQPRDGDEGTVAPLEPLLVGLHRPAGHVGLPHPALRPGQGSTVPVAVQQVVRVVVEQLSGGAGQQPLGVRVDGDDAPLLVHRVGGGAEGGQQRGERGRHGRRVLTLGAAHGVRARHGSPPLPV